MGASAGTAAGPRANQQLHGTWSSRAARSSPEETSGSHATAMASATAIGTIAIGTAYAARAHR